MSEELVTSQTVATRVLLVDNDVALAEQMIPTLERVVGTENTLLIPPTMGGEDFAYFALEVPGFFFRLGTVAPGTVSGGHHTEDFRADDASIPVGMRAMANLLLEYLEQQKDATDG